MTLFLTAFSQSVQEKIHIMTDAELYAPGDTIWMRIWLQDGMTLKDAQTESQFVYVNLYNNKDERQARVRIKKRDDRFTGYMILPKTLLSGDYTLSAYTLYMSNFANEYLYRKTIHILSKSDAQIGFKARPIYEGYLPQAEPIEVQGTKVYSTHTSDTLSVVTLEAPQNTWLSISVTDDNVSPIDTTASIVNKLLKVPYIFTPENLAADSLLSEVSFFQESQDFVYGRIVKPTNTVFELYSLNLKTGKLYRTFSKASDGKFIFANVDTPEGSIYDIAIYQNGRAFNKEIDMFSIALPDSIPHIATDAKQYYVNNMIDKMKRREPLTAEETQAAKRLNQFNSISLNSDTIDQKLYNPKDKKDLRELDLKRIVERNFYVDDSYTLHASKSIYADNFPGGITNQFIHVVMKEFPGVTVVDSIPMYKDNAGKVVPVRIVVGEKEIPLQTDSTGKMIPRLETFMPCGFVYAVDFITVKDAQNYFPSKQYPNSPIIRIDTFKTTDTYRYYHSQRIVAFESLGYQPTLLHNNLKVRYDEVHTRYWNPAICSGPKGEVRLELPLPLHNSTSYTLRAEGVTPDGDLVSIIRRITL